MIKRKTVVEKVEKIRAPRAKRLKVDFDSAPPALVDGKFTVPVKGRIFFERTLNGVKRVHEGHVTEVTEAGLVSVFDETVEQFYVFDPKVTRSTAV